MMNIRFEEAVRYLDKNSTDLWLTLSLTDRL